MLRSYSPTPAQVGEYIGLMFKAGGAPESVYSLAGRLYCTPKGWVMLSVPNALVRGAFDALNEVGLELPLNSEGRLNAHISVIRPEELERIGGKDKISELGHTFRWQMGPLQVVDPDGWSEMSKAYFFRVNSPDLEKMRKSYGLSPLPNENKFNFHCTVAVRRKKVTQHNDVTKQSAESELWAWQNNMGPYLSKGANVMTKQRVRLILPTPTGHLLELFDNPKYPENLGQFRFPGGGVEDGETLEQAALREAKEEFGATLPSGQFAYRGHDHRPGMEHEHYLELTDHGLAPGSFADAANSGSKVTLFDGKPSGEKYIGPDLGKLIVPSTKQSVTTSKTGPQVYYHGSPLDDLVSLREGSYITPDRDTALLMGRFHPDTGKTWSDADLKSPHYFGRPAEFLPGREPTGQPTLYEMLVDDQSIDKMNNTYEHKLLSSVPVSRASSLPTKQSALISIPELKESKKPRQPDDILPGGLADNKTDADFDPATLTAGRQVEKEHTSSGPLANEIARDHLTEDPEYYEKLKKVEEKSAEKDRPVPADWNDPADREDCPSCGVMHERGDGYCNSCGERWPAKTASLYEILGLTPERLS